MCFSGIHSGLNRALLPASLNHPQRGALAMSEAELSCQPSAVHTSTFVGETYVGRGVCVFFTPLTNKSGNVDKALGEHVCTVDCGLIPPCFFPSVVAILLSKSRFLLALTCSFPSEGSTLLRGSHSLWFHLARSAPRLSRRVLRLDRFVLRRKRIPPLFSDLDRSMEEAA